MSNTSQNNQTTSPAKRIAALIGVILLVLLYLVTLILAIVDSSASAGMFQASLFATIAIPLLIWIYTWLIGRFTQKKTIADFEPFKQEFEASASDCDNQASDDSDVTQ